MELHFVMGSIKWTYDMIKNEASKYSSKNEFKKNNRCAYQAALRKNIIDDLFENVNITWDEELVRNESLKYKTKNEFKHKCPGAYQYAIRHNLIDELYDNLYEYWTDESVEELAKSCKTKKEFYQNSGAYGYAIRHNLLKKFTWLVCENDEIERCVYLYTDEENKVAYIGLTANKEERHKSHKTGIFREKRTKSAVFDYFTSIGKDVPDPIYLEDGLSLIESQDREDYYIKLYEERGYRMLNTGNTGVGVGSTGFYKWSKKKVIEVASRCNTKIELHNKYKGAYDYAIRNNLIDELFDNARNVWNDESVKDIASKCKNRSEFHKKYKGAYLYAERNDLLEDLFGKTNHWNDINIGEYALKCDSRNDFSKKYPGAYHYAYRHGLLEKLFPNDIIIERTEWNEEMVTNESKKYKNRSDFKNRCSGAYKYAKRYNMLDILFPKK